jgi:hypothetical protein
VALALTIDGTDRIGYLQYGSLKVTDTDAWREARCDFTLVGFTPFTLDTLVIADGATTYFDGTVQAVALTEHKPGTWYARVSGHGAGGAAAAPMAPFSLSDADAEDSYTAMIADGFGFPSIFQPYAWWRLGEASGTNAVDEEGIQDGTYVNAPTLGVAGPMTTGDTAVTFNGTDEYVTCGSQHLGGQTDFSIAAWAKSSSGATTQTIYCERHATTGNAMVRLSLDANGRPTFAYRDDGGGAIDSIVPTSGDWTDDAWHHFVVTKDATAIVIYVDGVSVKTGTLTNDNTLTGMAANIAKDPRTSNELFVGSLGQVMIWREAITSSMVHRLYAMRDVKRYASLEWSTVLPSTTTAKATTYDAGLLPGQYLTVTSGNFALVGVEYQVKEVSVTWKNATTPLYTVVMGTALITLAAAFA